MSLNKAAGQLSPQSLYFQIILPPLPKMQHQHPQPCRHLYSQSNVPKKKALISFFHLPRSINHKLTVVGTVVLSCSQTAVLCSFPTLLNVISKYRLQLFEYLCGCAALPFSSLSPLMQKGCRPHFSREVLAVSWPGDSACCRLLQQGKARGS